MRAFLLRPWRSVWFPRIVTALALVAGLPIFLRMPLWCDLTLYDIAARNLLEGGVHYRDVFDTNLPGFVWLLAGIRAVVGFGAFELRCVDLAIVVGIVLLIDRLAKRGGASLATRWWAFAGAALLYPFSVEMTHCQRDTWMALPALAAVVLRLRRMGGIDPSPQPPPRSGEGENSQTPPSLVGKGAGGLGRCSGFWLSLLEGTLWGVAVWIKPHIVLMAAAVWLVTARRLANGSERPWRAITRDLLGNIIGGLLIGAAGIAYLVASGTWAGFTEVLTVWAGEYMKYTGGEIEMRIERQLHWFPPWSLWVLLTIPLAVLSMVDGLAGSRRGTPDDARPGPIGRILPAWLWDRTAGPDARFARAVLATLYLVWALQAFFVQRAFMYVHLPETFLMFGLWAAHRWAMPFVCLVWLVLTSGAWLLADASPHVRSTLVTVARSDAYPGGSPETERYLIRHPLADPTQMQYWPDCWRFGMTDRERYILWDRIKRKKGPLESPSPGWEELDEVTEFLRGKVGDGQLIAWHDSPHVIYLMMGLKPGLQYMHVNTMLIIGPESHDRVMAELARREGVARYAIADLLCWTPTDLAPPAGPGDLLPATLAPSTRVRFPYNQKPVFRSGGGTGRYIVFELTPPFRDLGK